MDDNILALLAVFFIVICTAVGSLFFFLGYGVMFVSAFGLNKKIGVVLLVLLAFSVVFFIWAGLPAYYVVPIWFIPPIYAQLVYEKTPQFKKAMKWFWFGLLLLVPIIWLLLDVIYFGVFFEDISFNFIK